MQGGGDIVAFINALRGADNALREQAERQLDEMIKGQPWVLAENLFVVVNENRGGPEVVQYAFVVMKHIFSEIASLSLSKNKRKLANALAGVDLNKYGNQLLSYLGIVAKQPDTPLRINVIRCTASFAEIILHQSQWPGLMQTINSLVMSNNLDGQIVGATMAEEISSISAKPLMNAVDSLIELLAVISSKPLNTFKASVLAIISNVYSNIIITVSTKSNVYSKLCSMTTIYWMFLRGALNEGDVESCKTIISSAILLLQVRTKLCNEGLLSGFNFMGDIITAGPEVPISVKESAITLYSMFIKNFTKQLFYPGSRMSPHSSPKRKGTFVNIDVNANIACVEKVIEVLVVWCSDIADNENWVTEDPEREDDDDESKYKPDGSKYLYTLGQDMLDSLAISLGYRIMFGILKKLTPRLLISPEWTARSTACIMYCICAEGLGNVPESLETVKEANVTLTNDDIIQICSWVCSLVNDPHPRVRWAVAQTLGQMCIDLSPKVQKLCGGLVADTLHKLMDDAPSPNPDLSLVANCRYSNMEAYFARPCLRVVAHSASSLGNFYTESKIAEGVGSNQNYIIQSIEVSLEKISRLMSLDNIYIQKNCITTLGCIANTSSAFFATKYNVFIGPCLVQLERYLSGQLNEPASKRPFSHQLIETISLIGHAVGPERFKEDGVKFMNMLINYKVIGEGCTQNESLLRSALFKAMSNVNNSMGRYLQQNHINAMMLTICDTLKSDLTTTTILNPDDVDDDDYDGDGDLEVYDIGGMKVRYNTAILEEIEDASDLLELLVDDHFIETSSFYNTILDLSVRILQNQTQTMTEFALSNILSIVRGIKRLIKCMMHPEKNETGLAITVTMDDIKVIQQNIYGTILPMVIKLLPDFDVEINASGICIDILRSFIFSAPQYIIGPDPIQNKNNVEEYYIKPMLTNYESVTSYFKEVVENEEGDYDEPYILDEKDNYSKYLETIGLALASGFSFMKKHPNFNFVDVYCSYFNEIVIKLLSGLDEEERELYGDTRVAGCIVGQNIVKLPSDVLNGSPVLKQNLVAVINAALQILTESLNIKGSGASVILPSSEYPTLQSGYYVLKCIISVKENIQIITEAFEYVSKVNGINGGAWGVLDLIVDRCMKFTKLCLGDSNTVDSELQMAYDNACSCWFSCTTFGQTRYVEYFSECLTCMRKITDDPMEIADIIKTIHHMFMSPTDLEKQYVSRFASQLLAVLIVLICNNVIRYSLRPSVIALAKSVLTNAQASDPKSFVEIVKSLNNPIIEVDIVEFMRS